MVRPFISFTPQRRKRAEWLAEVLKSLGFDEAILGSGGEPKASRKKIRDELERAECFLALVSPLRKSDGKAPEPGRPAPWIEQELGVAVHREIPVVLLWEKGMERSPILEEVAFASEEASFDDPEELLALTPKVIAIAARIRGVSVMSAGADYPFISEKVHVINRLSETEWCQLRTLTLTALKRAEYIDHFVDVGMDNTPGLSVKLADEEDPRYLSVTCTRDRGRIHHQVIKNTENEVGYKVLFTPPLKPGETIVYRHESHHANIFPLTLKDLRQRVNKPGSPPFMKDGYFGDSFDVTRPIDTLILEAEAPLDLGLTSPRVKVYAMNTLTEIEEESQWIGDPESRPGQWEVIHDEAREQWNCRVTIRKPKIGYNYCLLMRPSK